MSEQENIEATKRFGNAIASGDFSVFGEIMTRDVVDHDPAPGQAPGPEGFAEFFTVMRSAFPDLATSVDHMVATDNEVAIAYQLTGTHEGDFMGIPATGRKVKVRGVQISRFEDGKMAERWGSSDEFGILRQIGAVKEAG